jgi:hypothetical protein
MIRFTCEKCGKKIRTSSKSAGKKEKCPKCKSPVTVPSLADKSDAEIVREVLDAKPRRDSRHRAEGKRRSLLRPHYDEVTLFSMSVIFVLLLLMSKTMRGDLHKAVSRLFEDGDAQAVMGFILLLVIFLGGAAYCIFHAFSAREKSVPEKAAMLFFALLVSGGIGMYAGKHMLETSTGWLMLFPIWNVIYGGLLLMKLGRLFAAVRYGRPIDVSYISDENATRRQIMLGLIAVVIIIICCQFWFGLHWAVTFSICIAYTTSLDKAVRSVFGRR